MLLGDIMNTSTKSDAQPVAYNVSGMIDFTLLDARATQADIEKLCDIAYKNEYYAVCVNPCNVAYAKGYILKNFDGALKVVTVVGFPLGANTTETKCFETAEAIKNGADEIDVVVNIAKVKQGEYAYVQRELSKIVKTAKHHVTKAIFETCYLDDNEIIKLCKVAAKAKVTFVKTSTGFGTGGATEHSIQLMAHELQGKCKIKAAGGIRTREQAVRLINLGASRIGTSRIL